jgi:hypothetical protein
MPPILPVPVISFAPRNLSLTYSRGHAADTTVHWFHIIKNLFK